jgi:hypothetical protein
MRGNLLCDVSSFIFSLCHEAGGPYLYSLSPLVYYYTVYLVDSTISRATPCPPHVRVRPCPLLPTPTARVCLLQVLQVYVTVTVSLAIHN